MIVTQKTIRYSLYTIFISLLTVVMTMKGYAEQKVQIEESASTSKYETYMNILVGIARRNPHRAPFVAMIINEKEDKLLCLGMNDSGTNPVLHGEIDAINRCVELHPNIDWSTTTLLTTAEPCPMCASAMMWAGIPRIVYGTSIETLVRKGWSQIDIDTLEIIRRTPFHQAEVISDVLSHMTDPLFDREIIEE